MVESIGVRFAKPPQKFGQYPTTRTIHRVKINSDGVAVSLCGKRFRPRNVFGAMAANDYCLCKFCERLDRS